MPCLILAFHHAPLNSEQIVLGERAQLQHRRHDMVFEMPVSELELAEKASKEEIVLLHELFAKSAIQ